MKLQRPMLAVIVILIAIICSTASGNCGKPTQKQKIADLCIDCKVHQVKVEKLAGD